VLSNSGFEFFVCFFSLKSFGGKGSSVGLDVNLELSEDVLESVSLWEQNVVE